MTMILFTPSSLMRFATATMLLVATSIVVPVVAQDIPDDEAKHVATIRLAIEARDWDAARVAWDSAQGVHPTSVAIVGLGVDLGQGMMRDQQWESARSVALQAADKLVPLARTPSDPATASLQVAASMQALIAVRLEKTEEGLAAYEALSQRIEAPSVREAILQRQLVWMASVEKIAAATEKLDPILNEARGASRAAPDDLGLRLRLYGWLDTQAQVLGFQSADATAQRASLEEGLALFDLEMVLSDPSNAELVKAFLDAHVKYVATVGRTDPDVAMERLTATRAAIAKLRETQATAALMDSAEKSLAASERRITTALKHRSLIGELSPPLEPIAWVNGPAVTAEGLRGKVVLIDFWAVWCGPCIATFPHLRDWQQRFSDEGLVIIGATRHYGYDWDASLKRSVKRDNVSGEAENLALEAFAAHHELRHVFAVFDNTSLYEFFGVSGIPQAVLLDRSGRVRMIKVGSGEANASELEGMIETLLRE